MTGCEVWVGGVWLDGCGVWLGVCSWVGGCGVWLGVRVWLVACIKCGGVHGARYRAVGGVAHGWTQRCRWWRSIPTTCLSFLMGTSLVF